MELTIGILGCLVLVCIVVAGVPIAFGIGLVGIVGSGILLGFHLTGIQLYQVAFHTLTEFLLTSIPLYLFMGQLISRGQIGDDLYKCIYMWLGRLPGGLAITSVASCASVGAVTGGSLAALSIVGKISIPQMQKYGYSDSFAAGSVASASTLGILIPPSIPLIVYGIWTETSIGKLFIAGIIPGLFLGLVFATYILITAIFRPSIAPVGPRFSWSERLKNTVHLLPIAAIFAVVIGGLYAGLFTPSEGAAIGSAMVLIVLLVMGRLTWSVISEAAKSAAQLSVMIFTIIIAVNLFSRFLVLTDVPQALIDSIVTLELNRYVMICLIIVAYLLLGMILDSIGMMLLTLPFVFPIVQELGFEGIWFGIILCIMIEVGLLTPPLGMNCYILNQLVPSVPVGAIFRGVVPFVILSLATVALFIVFPEIILWLPAQMK